MQTPEPRVNFKQLACYQPLTHLLKGLVPNLLIILLLHFFPILIQAQVAESFYENGRLKSTVPLNEEGLFDGIETLFYDTGELAMETPYLGGIREGIEKAYYPDGGLKLQQNWQSGLKKGELFAYFPDGNLRLYALMEGDSVLFAQRFDDAGHLVIERVNHLSNPIDTTNLERPVIVRPETGPLRPNEDNPVQIYIPRIPSSFITYFSPHGSIIPQEDGQFPLILRPNGRSDIFVLYLKIKTHPTASPILLRKIKLTVE